MIKICPRLDTFCYNKRMKVVITLLLFALHVNSLTLTLNSAKENAKPYAILHLVDDTPILCETKEEAYEKKLYLCMFDGTLKNKIKPKKTPYVDIDFLTKDGNFYIYIKPKMYSKMINTDAKLYESKTTPLKSQKNAKHWTIIIYEKLPFSKTNRQNNGMNFPVTYPKLQYPSVGALDLNGVPISYVQSNDINLYLEIKKLYEKNEYEEVIDEVEKALQNYPNSIFISEFILYKIRSIDKILDNEDIKSDFDRSDVVSLAKGWTKTFTANENMPEVLMLIAKSYLDMGFYSDGNYFLDMLLSEHPESNFTQWAILMYADSLYKNGKKKEAVKLFEDVLYASKDLDTASEAALRLAKYSLNKGKITKAKEYLKKVLNANKEFVFKDEEAAYALAQSLANKELYSIAASIATTLLSKAKKSDENYEALLKNTGLWNEKAKNINDAYQYLKRYQKEFKQGEYEVVVQQALDRLFFELSETNETKLANYYDELIKRYDNDIGYKALLAKARLHLSKKEYDKVLQMKDKLSKDTNSSDAKNILQDAAFWAVNSAMNEDRCLEAIRLIETYAEVEDKLQDKMKLFKCFMRTSRYKKAENLVKKYGDTKDLHKKLMWMISLEDTLFAQKRWQETISLAKDIETLGGILKDKRANEALYNQFFALMNLVRYEDALEVAIKIEERMPNNFKNVEVYERIAKMAKEQGNDLVLVAYAKKALNLQKEPNVFIYTPNLEYDYIASLQRLNRYEEARDEALLILQRKLKQKDRGRAFYTIAEAYVKTGEIKKANEYFEKCVQFDEQGSWGKICSENLSLKDKNSSQ